MYLELNQIFSYFEYVSEPISTYFNEKNYQINSKKERDELINFETFDTSDFLIIPQINRNEIVVKYLTEKNNQSLLRKQNDKDFYHRFHWYTEDNLLVDEWIDFEKTELIKLAVKWCEQNQIKFTMK